VVGAKFLAEEMELSDMVLWPVAGVRKANKSAHDFCQMQANFTENGALRQCLIAALYSA
jgi:hypothetical protein